MRAVGTFCLAKKDVSRENKRRNEKERETCWQSRGEERRVKGGGGSVQWAPAKEQTRSNPALQGETRKRKHTQHHSHQEATLSLCSRPNILNYSCFIEMSSSPPVVTAVCA